MEILAILWWLVKAALMLAGAFEIATWVWEWWQANIERRRDRESSVWLLFKTVMDYCIHGFITIASRHANVAIFARGSADKLAKTGRIHLLWHPERRPQLKGVFGLYAAHSKQPQDGKVKVTWSLFDDHRRYVSFSEVVERPDDVAWTAITALLETAEAYEKWGCKCLAEAKFRELEEYAATGLLNGCLMINIPEDAPAGVRLALSRFSEWAIHASIRLGP